MAENKNIPEIRFKGFSEDWEECNLGSVAEIKTGPFGSTLHAEDYVKDGEPIITTEHFKSGDLPNNKKGIPQVSSEDYARLKVYLLRSGDIVFSRVGSIDINAHVKSFQDGWLFSGRVLRVRTTESIDSEYLHHELSTTRVRNNVISRAVGQTMPSINTIILKDTPIQVPKDTNEQSKIGSFINHLDCLITLHQRKYDKLVTVKKAMLEKMFPQNGAVVPEIRFKGFTEDWEVRKFGECVLIQRGGSPRPIENFTTNDENGINWIKIGDVSIGSRYITKTKEKIIPEGERHSRKVQKGDLILSNSMSFGRPYIMAIDGCIHDGWLLIRDEKKMFDLEYLLQLLSSDYMLEQYRALASGGVVINLNSELVQSTNIFIPDKNEQYKIGQFFSVHDNLITLQQRELEKLKNIKKACLEKMFV